MAPTKKKTSIKDILQFNNLMMIGLTILPVLVISIVYLGSLRQYQDIIKNVNAADEIRLEAPEEINQALWYQISGKNDKDTTPIDIIGRYEEQLQQLKNDASTTELRQTADWALRILKTVERYAWQIDSNINNKRPVADSEKILDVIREVNEQLGETLQEYVTSEINLANQRSQEISKLIYGAVFVELVILLGLVIFVFNFRKTLNHAISEPLHEITGMVSQVAHGDWQARVSEMDVSEMDELRLDLNEMANQIEILFDQNTQKQKSLAVSEMKVLQAQITPHFIYNTLDAILTLAQQGDNESVEKATLALSDYFKITLNKGSEWITVEREVQHVKSYLDILKIRYGAILNYELTIDPAIKEQVMLKMLLQPLVENAMYHGIKNSRRRGLIEVIGGQKDQQVFFTVTDNGNGMTPQRLAQVRASLNEVAASHEVPLELERGYGLYNVYRRIKLYFGEEAELAIESTPGVGTVMTLLLPHLQNPNTEGRT